MPDQLPLVEEGCRINSREQTVRLGMTILSLQTIQIKKLSDLCIVSSFGASFWTSSVG